MAWYSISPTSTTWTAPGSTSSTGCARACRRAGRRCILVIPPTSPVHDSLRLAGRRASRRGRRGGRRTRCACSTARRSGRLILQIALERDLFPVARAAVADLGVDLVRRRVVEVGVEHAPLRARGQRAPAGRRDGAAGVAAAPMRRRRVDRARSGRRRPPRGLTPSIDTGRLVVPHEQTVAAHETRRPSPRPGAAPMRPASRHELLASSRRAGRGRRRRRGEARRVPGGADRAPPRGRAWPRASSCAAVPPVRRAHAAAIARAVRHAADAVDVRVRL